MTIAASYVMSIKYQKTYTAGTASDTDPVIVANSIPLHYSIDMWSANATAVAIDKCSLCSWDGFQYKKLLALTDSEKVMQSDFLGLLTSAATNSDIQAFLNGEPASIAIMYIAATGGEATDVTRLFHIQLSSFKAV